MSEYLMCECPTPSFSCCGGRGPAVYRVKRKGRALNLCTRCTLPDDKNHKLIIDGNYDAHTLVDFDPLGAFVVIAELAEKVKKGKKRNA